MASLDTLSGEEIPLHLLLRLHGYIIQVSKTHPPCDTRGPNEAAGGVETLVFEVT